MPGIYEALVPLKADHGGVCRFGDGKDDKGNLELVMGNILYLYYKAIENGELVALPSVPAGKELEERLEALKSE